jgi:hypothetical protein
MKAKYQALRIVCVRQSYCPAGAASSPDTVFACHLRHLWLYFEAGNNGAVCFWLKEYLKAMSTSPPFFNNYTPSHLRGRGQGDKVYYSMGFPRKFPDFLGRWRG